MRVATPRKKSGKSTKEINIEIDKLQRLNMEFTG